MFIELNELFYSGDSEKLYVNINTIRHFRRTMHGNNYIAYDRLEPSEVLIKESPIEIMQLIKQAQGEIK